MGITGDRFPVVAWAKDGAGFYYSRFPKPAAGQQFQASYLNHEVYFHRLGNKQNGFDDFIAAGEFLIAEGITGQDQLAIQGGSNGGLLVGAVTNQRPDLFAAALPALGVMDMLRFDRFTSGRFWVVDYGAPSKEADFRNLYAYSPYHNIRAGQRYPAILATTADTDDRVVPGYTF